MNANEEADEIKEHIAVIHFSRRSTSGYRDAIRSGWANIEKRKDAYQYFTRMFCLNTELCR
jgi:hypothetical protein